VQIDPKAAEASLSDIDTIVACIKRSSFYRSSGRILIIWGVFVAFGNLAAQLLPNQVPLVWVVASGLGLLATITCGFMLRRASMDFDWRIVIALLLFFGFGLICCRLGNFGPRELDAFWPVLFMFGYALAGLWLGLAYIGLGIGVAILTFAGYLWIETWFELYLAIVNGGGLCIAGLWMRRA
jgi:multidrug transporter EmrE-like cation transporter